MPVDFDDLEVQLAANQAGHVGLLLSVVTAADFGNLRCRHKATHTVEVDQETAFVVINDLGFDNLVVVSCLLQHTPGLLLTGTVNRQDSNAILVLRLRHKHENSVADLQRLALIFRKRREFPGGNDAF